MGSPENPNLFFDYIFNENLYVPGGDLPSLDPPGLTWQSHSLTALTPPSGDMDDAFANFDGLKETGSRKRMKSASCNASGSKASREKMRRDRLNDRHGIFLHTLAHTSLHVETCIYHSIIVIFRFLELASILACRRPSKMDKVAVLGDAVQMVNQLCMEAQKLKASNEELREKINELKAEKSELREEKLRLKTEKDSLEVKIKSTNPQSGFLHPSPIMPAPFSGPGQVVGSKLVPFMGYPGVSMWQFMPPAAVDTSQDHVMRPPAA